ncbi:MAG TPA: enoyl-CoA hydratase-related protein [Streptosporangiaceae bacterium]
MPDTVRYTVDGSVASITLNRPESRNSLNVAAKTELLAAVRRAADDEQIRAVILTGEGRAFCSGQDLREHAAGLASGGDPLNTVREHYNPLISAITTMPKPVVAAVNGVAAGAGASLALACDFRLAARGASLLMAFARVGLGPDSGSSWTLQRLAGPARAAELLMLAEPIDAATAAEYGLFSKVVADEELAADAAALAARLAAGPTAAYAGIKEALSFAAMHTLAESLEKEAELQAWLGKTADHRAATEAFVSKQQPIYQGR